MDDAKQQFRFDFEWRTSLFVVLLVPLMAGLGVWQLDRAEEKEALAKAFDLQQKRPPALLESLWDSSAEELAYLPVRLRGTFAEETYFLLDNRIQDGKFGYEVLAIVQLDGEALALVNRGWIAGDASRLTLPDVPTMHSALVDGAQNVTGHLYVAPGAPYLLAEQKLGGEWPQRIQAVEMDKLVPYLEGRYGKRVFPYPVRIAPGSDGALSARWQIINISPEKHLGYAVQWFSMSAVLLMFYILRSSNLWQLVKGRRSARSSTED